MTISHYPSVPRLSMLNPVVDRGANWRATEKVAYADMQTNLTEQ